MRKDNSDKKTNLPDFLIVGAAKSGTTAVYHYLDQHPEVFMSSVKEPSFFLSQFTKMPQKGFKSDERKTFSRLEDYMELFKNIQNEKAVGEASTDNLYYHEGVIPQIKKFIGDPKIMIILRNPVDRAFSAYKYLLRENREVFSFEKALAQEEKRKQEGWRFIWFYKEAGFYYAQVKAYLENFIRVKIFLYDDLVKNPVEFMKDMYGFLGVDDSFKPDVSIRHNQSNVCRIKCLRDIYTSKGRFRSAVRFFGTLFLGEDRWIKIREKIKNLFPMKIDFNPDTRRYLYGIFYQDILKLQTLIKRDLSHWLDDKNNHLMGFK